MEETHHILFYDYVENMVERRLPHREGHLDQIEAARGRGELVLAGALGDPPHGGALVFRGVGVERIEAYVREDPYVKGGLVRNWRIERWNLV
jgi:uncharacterized protein YciI